MCICSCHDRDRDRDHDCDRDCDLNRDRDRGRHIGNYLNEPNQSLIGTHRSDSHAAQQLRLYQLD